MHSGDDDEDETTSSDDSVSSSSRTERRKKKGQNKDIGNTSNNATTAAPATSTVPILQPTMQSWPIMNFQLPQNLQQFPMALSIPQHLQHQFVFNNDPNLTNSAFTLPANTTTATAVTNPIEVFPQNHAPTSNINSMGAKRLTIQLDWTRSMNGSSSSKKIRRVLRDAAITVQEWLYDFVSTEIIDDDLVPILDFIVQNTGRQHDTPTIADSNNDKNDNNQTKKNGSKNRSALTLSLGPSRSVQLVHEDKGDIECNNNSDNESANMQKKSNESNIIDCIRMELVTLDSDIVFSPRDPLYDLLDMNNQQLILRAAGEGRWFGGSNDDSKINNCQSTKRILSQSSPHGQLYKAIAASRISTLSEGMKPKSTKSNRKRKRCKKICQENQNVREVTETNGNKKKSKQNATSHHQNRKLDENPEKDATAQKKKESTNDDDEDCDNSSSTDLEGNAVNRKDHNRHSKAESQNGNEKTNKKEKTDEKRNSQKPKAPVGRIISNINGQTETKKVATTARRVLGEDDVVFSRMKEMQGHIGNARYREQIEAHFREYSESGSKRKKEIVDSIMSKYNFHKGTKEKGLPKWTKIEPGKYLRSKIVYDLNYRRRHGHYEEQGADQQDADRSTEECADVARNEEKPADETQDSDQSDETPESSNSSPPRVVEQQPSALQNTTVKIGTKRIEQKVANLSPRSFSGNISSDTEDGEGKREQTATGKSGNYAEVSPIDSHMSIPDTNTAIRISKEVVETASHTYTTDEANGGNDAKPVHSPADAQKFDEESKNSKSESEDESSASSGSSTSSDSSSSSSSSNDTSSTSSRIASETNSKAAIPSKLVLTKAAITHTQTQQSVFDARKIRGALRRKPLLDPSKELKFPKGRL